MIRRCLAVVGVLGVLVACAPLASAEPTLEQRLDAAVTAKLAEMSAPGVIVGISVPGDIDYVRALGTADTATGAPISVDDHMRIGSVTKTFTGTAVLQLVDQGRISLLDPISRYVDGVPDGDAITLDMLGRMRSGLFDYTKDQDAFLGPAYTESPKGPDAFAFTPQRILDIAFAHPPNFAPGVEYEYSNTNTVLLAMVVERVSGTAFGDYLAQYVFGAAGLTRTSYPSNGAMPEPFAHGYTPAPDGRVLDATFWNPSWGDAAGRIVSTYADQRIWASVLGTGALLSPATQAARLSNMSSVIPDVGYGFAIFNAHGWIGHNGDIPGYTTVTVYLPERDATLVVMVNSDAPEPHSAGQIATAVTQLVTPEHVYRLAGVAPTAGN
ncbi:serine hydrolase domain-containing protein [Mycolicibacterium arenosum]|uniref:Beta-lactamase family protein n=1 Tax=Mycolicibacterium arenosum TaxID=2952157 RepID=A0ABT1LW34_9MYCO|nr:serine hydrolase domain-containing protein [Mycolicibacterium sp. CAU 1645]MCP9271103.1 beta-lactamase family protein [Mycolicibacterium sp. CAU 1645]